MDEILYGPFRQYISLLWYWVPALISVLGALRLTLRNVREDNGILFFREFITTLSLVIFAVCPGANVAMAFIVLWHFVDDMMTDWFNLLERYKKVEIFNFNRNKR